MRSAVRWTVAAVVLVAAFFGTWFLCVEFLHALGRDVVLSMAGLATAVVSLPAGAWAAREKGLTVGKRSLVSARSLGAPLGQVVVGEIPRRPAAFQVRDDLRAELAAVRGVAVVTAVTGSRGIGKTHLAAAYARECVTEGWPVIAWIVAESPGQALSGMERLARVLGVAGPRDDALTCARNARAWLESQADARCLVVFDNVLDVEAIRVWLPSAGRARIIVTSTNNGV